MAERRARGLDTIEPASPSPAAKTTKKKAKKKAAKKAAPKPSKTKKAARVTVPTAQDYLTGLRGMLDEEHEDDFAFFADPAAWAGSVTEWVPTGSLAIDRLIGGGWPMGRIIEVAAWEGVGKSTIVDQSIAMAQRLGHVCTLIDSEQSRDHTYTASLGVDLSQLIVRKAETIEDGFIGIDQVISLQEAHYHKLKAKSLTPPAMLIFWDSLGGTPTRAEFEGAADDTHVMAAARNIRMNMRRINQRLAQTRSALIFTNHFYQSIGPGGPKLVAYGGGGVRYHASVRIWLSRIQALKVGTNVVGHIIEAKLKKTKVSKPRPPAKLGLINGAGIHNAWTLYEWGKTHGVGDGHLWVQVRGSWCYLMLPDGTYEGFQHSFLGFADILAKRPDIYQTLAAQYMSEDSNVELAQLISPEDDDD